MKDFMEKLSKLTPGDTDLEELCTYLFKDYKALPQSDKTLLKAHSERIWHILRLLKLMAEFFGDKLSFGGGAIINYLIAPHYELEPRLTFDLDTGWLPGYKAKRVVLVEIAKFNKWLADSNETLVLPIGKERGIPLYLVMYDREHDYFPQVLSLYIPVICRHVGEPFYSYLRNRIGVELHFSRILELKKLFEKTLGVREAKIDELRFEIASMPNTPTIKVKQVFPGKLGEVEFLMSELEWQIALKIVGKIGKNFGENIEYALHDILKATVDLRLVKYLNRSRLLEHLKNLSLSPSQVLSTAEKNLKVLAEKGETYWLSFHYTYLRKKISLRELVEEALCTIKELFSLL
ncbi:MAG: hypothetical protein DRJ52_02150 [Thermoprotei archaeon]|nr:MAG: hypothetical protein DRJ52_02150 [Thermoprotei archaeon]RLF00109.1 MAG: hypothetical protein DRJ63_03405 [Thermoprotei archaeon]HDI75022.1 hypothetical protein [Thermoprotei archaeon]